MNLFLDTTSTPDPLTAVIASPVRVCFYDHLDDGKVIGERTFTGQLSLIAQAVQLWQLSEAHRLDVTAAELVAFLKTFGFAIPDNIVR